MFVSRVAALDGELRARMTGVCWHPDPRCPPFEGLRLLSLSHWDFAGAVQTGQLVVAAAVADELVAMFAALYQLRFPIACESRKMLRTLRLSTLSQASSG